MEKMFRTHLFPTIHDLDEEMPLNARIPILHSPTRAILYNIVLSLSNDVVSYSKLLNLVESLLPQGEVTFAWSWGIAQVLEEYHYEPNWNFERLKCIRAPAGYPGLKNLSNTCYLNSLFTQLFMNVSFRQFMFDTNVTDSEGSQKLLYETQRLFAYMQETWLKSVDPQGIADSIVNYENTLIDTSIQMDVDEFYNLLFDRWESQIPAGDAKASFRKFYGGQIVQQIKSKECPHISERLEPFSAIQCDIQGKTSLIDSLNAYVEGEVMEGDNRYSCTSCGSYVDAVKRACLKDVPDNLIFHLKRFDYDVMTGLRSKINDYFAFPEELDMSPYTVEHLKDGEQTATPDMFKLVGIVVHSGNADSGHYYSYVRERPVHQDQMPTWVEFNDSDVCRFDPKAIPEQCFGGLPMSSPFTPIRFPKGFSAYMLFYERSTAMEVECMKYSPTSIDLPTKINLSAAINNQIAADNESWLRKYCLFDPEHLKFTRLLLDKLRILNKGVCSDDHSVEKQAIVLALEHIEQIISRAKDNPEYDSMLESLANITGSCAECCNIALQWVVESENALRNILLRCPAPRVREYFVETVLKALKYLRIQDPRLYGFDSDDLQDPNDAVGPRADGVFHKVVNSLKGLWPQMSGQVKSWDEYHRFVCRLAEFGPVESHVILCQGFLYRCLEVLCVDTVHANGGSVSKQYHHYMRLVEKNRKWSIYYLIELISVLLDRIYIQGEPEDVADNGREMSDGKAHMTSREMELFCYPDESNRPKFLAFLEKILNHDENQRAVYNIIRNMTLAEPQAQQLKMIKQTIMSSLSIDPADRAECCLVAALSFCEHCPTDKDVSSLIATIANDVDTIGIHGGMEHLAFFQQARRLRNIRTGRSSLWFQRVVLLKVPSWAPPLLLYHDTKVQEETLELLRLLVFDHDIQNMDDEQHADDIDKAARELCKACVRRIRDQVIQPGRSVDGNLVDDVTKIIKHCNVTYFHPEIDELDKRFVAEAESEFDICHT